MHPELFKIPFTPQTVKSYGTMMVIGFLVAVYLIRKLGRKAGLDMDLLTNAALYSLIAGIVGARIFYVIHYWDHYRQEPLKIFAVWQGGLEFLGGFIAAVCFLLIYLWLRRVAMRRYLDILAIGLMSAMIFGRIGCFLNGCCYGKPSNVPWAVRFPYGSYAYLSQTEPSLERDRSEPYLHLPRKEYFDLGADGQWYLKSWDELTEAQRLAVTKGPYQCLPVHPTQLYSSLCALLITLIMVFFWHRSRQERLQNRWWTQAGMTYTIMFILYGLGRFGLEMLRDDNPYEWASLTISQIISLGLILFGFGWVVFFICKGRSLRRESLSM